MQRNYRERCGFMGEIQRCKNVVGVGALNIENKVRN